MITRAIHSWQCEAWQNWQCYLAQKKVPHAILLHSRQGCKIHDFALRLCCSLLCSLDNVDKPCLECRTCRYFLSENHPDFLTIEADQKQIKIEQVRYAIDFLQISCHYSQHKVVLFKEVDNLNYAATNSLLKTLEEPPANTIIVMTCRQPSTLATTIRSRCHRIYIKEPQTTAEVSDNKDKLLFYKELEQCLAKQVTIHDFAEYWYDKHPPTEIQQWLLKYLQRTILKQAKEMSKNHIDSATTASLNNLLYRLHPRQIERCRLAEQNINPRLLLEASLLEWRMAHRNI